MNLPREVELLLIERGENDPRVVAAHRTSSDEVEAVYSVAGPGVKRLPRTVTISAGGDVLVVEGFPA